MLDHGVPGVVERVGAHGVGLGEGHDPVAHPEHVEDAQVLLALRHPPFVGGDDEQRDVDGPHSGEHVLDKALVAGHVDETDRSARG